LRKIRSAFDVLFERRVKDCAFFFKLEKLVVWKLEEALVPFRRCTVLKVFEKSVGWARLLRMQHAGERGIALLELQCSEVAFLQCGIRQLYIHQPPHGTGGQLPHQPQCLIAMEKEIKMMLIATSHSNTHA
jgi:hypothetical protein